MRKTNMPSTALNAPRTDLEKEVDRGGEIFGAVLADAIKFIGSKESKSLDDQEFLKRIEKRKKEILINIEFR